MNKEMKIPNDTPRLAETVRATCLILYECLLSKTNSTGV